MIRQEKVPRKIRLVTSRLSRLHSIEGKNVGIAQRLEKFDWHLIQQSLRDYGYAVTPALLNERECSDLVEAYSSDKAFRSHIIMSRYRFGRGDYKYFDYPLPPIVQELRQKSYPYLVPVASQWNEDLGAGKSFLRAMPLFLLRARKTDRLGPHLCCCITKPAISTACTRICMAQLRSHCN